MPHRSTLARQKLKEEDPEKYMAYLAERRSAEKEKRDSKKASMEAGELSPAILEDLERKRQEKNATQRMRDIKRKADSKAMRLTRNSSKPPETPAKQPKHMTEEELKHHRALLRRASRDRESSQKKTARKVLRRKNYHEKKLAEVQQMARASSSTSDQPQMKQSFYNLNHAYKQTTKALGMTPEQYGRSVLNLANPKTPEKRVAISQQQRFHPCRVLFEEIENNYDLEAELGIHVTDDTEQEHGPSEENASNTLHTKVQLFYCNDQISRMLPHARYSTKHGPARVMQCLVKDAHQMFLADHPDEKVGLTLFQSLRPRNVRLMGSVPVESCLCIYCTNVRLKINAINRLLGSSGQVPPEKDMLSVLCCPYDGRWPRIDCVSGKCDQCNDRMRPFRFLCRDIYSTPVVKWQHWQRNAHGKMEPFEKEGSLRDLMRDLEHDLKEPTKGRSFLEHLFNAYWQYSQFKECRTNPEEGEIVMVQDFGENRKAAYSAEIKSAHFGKQQVTVHPVVVYYRINDNFVRDSLIFLTDDITHDHQAVQEFTRQSIEILRKRVSIKKMTIWSDGAASQYKGRGSFHDLTLLPYQPQRCYYGSEHGKGEADGETGLMSQALKRAVYAGRNFACAKDMVEYLSSMYGTERRQYILVPEIDRTPVDEDILTIPGTQKYHQFQAIKEYVLQARRLSCFCTACRQGQSSRCLNLEIVGEYCIHKCKPSVKTALNTAFCEEAEEEAKASKEIKRTPFPKVGDIVKLTCKINRLQKVYYAMVLEVPEESESFSVRFLQKSGTLYAYGQEKDVGLVKEGPPDFYAWTVLTAFDYTMDHRGHFSFKV